MSCRNGGRALRLTSPLPLLPLRDVIVYPGAVLPLFIGRPASVAAIHRASGGRKLLFAAGQKQPETSEPRREDLHNIGVVCRLRQWLRLPDGTMRVVIEGLFRGTTLELLETEEYREVRVEAGPPEGRATGSEQALLEEVRSGFVELARSRRDVGGEMAVGDLGLDDPVALAYRIASGLRMPLADRQRVLEAAALDDRLRILRDQIAAQLRKARAEDSPGRRRRGAHADLRQEGSVPAPAAAEDDGASEIAGYRAWLGEARLPKPVHARFSQEVDRLSKMAPISPEAAVIRGYLEVLQTLPWTRRTRDRQNLAEAESILEADHYGLRPVKDRILEMIAILLLAGRAKGPILCLVGPPGVGKTSLGRSIARALGRRFARIALGGVRDEAEIRGHRRTYVGAMPGRVLQAMRRTRSVNPVILLDEVDKMGQDFRGDPAAALLEVLDPEQNASFCDHYLELEYDLSKALFITTANRESGIPPALLDRMEILRLPGYLDAEKEAIAERYLLPKQVEACGLPEGALAMDREALRRIIREYTCEAGVRGLERQIAAVCRKQARRIVQARDAGRAALESGAGVASTIVQARDAGRAALESGAGMASTTAPVRSSTPGASPAPSGVLPGLTPRHADASACGMSGTGPTPGIRIERSDVDSILGAAPFPEQAPRRRDRVGIATGLAWSESGGSILEIEVDVLPGRGKLLLTGRLGRVMRESAQTALSCVRSRCREIGLDPDFYREVDIHVHVPSGQVPKDGPSAGCAIFLAMVSALTGIPTRTGVALTGELTLRGQVLPIGGLAEKGGAAVRAGLRRVLIPDHNRRAAEELPAELRQAIRFTPVATADEVLAQGLPRPRLNHRATSREVGYHGGLCLTGREAAMRASMTRRQAEAGQEGREESHASHRIDRVSVGR